MKCQRDITKHACICVNIPVISNSWVDNLVLGIRPDVVNPLGVVQDLVDGGDGKHLDGGNLALLVAPEQPGTGLPVLDIAHGDQVSDRRLGVGVVGVGLALLGVQVPVDLGTLLLGGDEELGVVDVVLRQSDGGPKESTVVAVDSLTSRLLVTATGSVGNTRGPGVAGEPITASGDGEVGVLGRWVDDVSCEPVDKVLVLGQPGGVVLGNDGSNSEEVSVVEVVVVVVTVTKVDTRVGSAGLVNNTTPRGLVSGRSSGGRLEPVVERSLEVVGDIRDQFSMANSLTVRIRVSKSAS